MINIGGNPLMIILAIVAALGGVGLYFVRNFRPELARDHDIFFSAIALVYGIILLAFNFRMEITTQLAQVLVVGFAGWFAVESLILRQALSTQARRSPMNPFVDDPVSNPDYRAEIDPYREIPARRPSNTRRMRGTEPTSRPTELRGDVDQERRSRRPKRSSSAAADSVIDIDEEDIWPVSPKPRRSRPSDRPSSKDSNKDSNRDRDNNQDISRNSNREGASDRNNDVDAPPRKRRPRPRPEAIPDLEPSDPEDY